MFIIIEIRLRKKIRINELKRIEDSKIKFLKEELSKADSLSKKISVIDIYAKKIFNERFNFGIKKSYHELIEIFDSKKAYNYSLFCRKMFEVYYSHDILNENKIKDLLSILINILREKESYLEPDNYSIDTIYEGKSLKKSENRHLSSLFRFDSIRHFIFNKRKILKQKPLIFKKSVKVNKLPNLPKLVQDNKNPNLQKNSPEKQNFKVSLNKKVFEESRDSKRNDKDWREEINDGPVLGKEWLKENRKKRRTIIQRNGFF